ncbi:RDD family protein [Lysobacter koreensis]|uniref:RDD family protein n=1 Tax=Lysobacter koreensis TaxID=266122 RepID=A0ABW2YNL5_9GAMM
MASNDTHIDASNPPAALIGWRLLALFYDLWPAAALWMAVAAAFLVAHHNQPLAPFSALQWLLWALCWALTGAYATLSWRRGGQTLGMRPWRLRVVGIDGAAPTWRALGLRYVFGSASLLLGGLGFWWAWLDRERLTWHDRVSGTRMRREPKQG